MFIHAVGVSQLTNDLDKLRKTADALKALKNRQQFHHAEFFVPYVKQQDFFHLGLTKRERMLRAGNQLGKTEAGAFEASVHLTGQYPEWWTGRRWDRPVKTWVSGVTGLSTRDVVQKKLMGEPGVTAAFGTGMIPKPTIIDTSLARGVSNAYDTVSIKHVSGGTSVLKFKSYEQGRQKWQGDTLDFVWFDEEPPEDIYDEGLTRLTGNGMAYLTFTPLEGMSEVVMRFLEQENPDRGEVVMTIDDVTHFSDKEKDERVRGYKGYEREARRNGVPMQGSGRIFQTTETAITEPPLVYIPREWTWNWGVDFGVGHPFAAALILWDRESDVVHVHHVLRMKGEDDENASRPLYHAAAMKPFGWVPVAWPQDGTQRQQGMGQTMALSTIYKKNGLRMLPEHAQWPDGSNSTEAGVAEMDERFATGRLKVAEQLKEFFEEYRNYHRKDGLIVKVRDDILSAVRVAIMGKRFGMPHSRLVKPNARQINAVAKGLDFDLFRT